MEYLAIRIITAMTVLMSLGLLAYVLFKVEQMRRQYEELQEKYLALLDIAMRLKEPTAPKPVDEVK